MSENDNDKLKPAEENPWYVLATIHGEEPDEKTQISNRIAWNSWAFSRLSESEKKAFILLGKVNWKNLYGWEGENGMKKKLNHYSKKDCLIETCLARMMKSILKRQIF